MGWGQAAAGFGLGVLGSAFGGGDGMSSDQRWANIQSLEAQREMWKAAMLRSRAQFQGLEAQIRGQGMANMGTATAGLASSGLLNTTAGLNAARAVNLDTQRSLLDLARTRAATEYSQWMDRAKIEGMTEFGPAGSYVEPSGGNAFAPFLGYAGGGVLHDVDWGALFE